MTEQIKSAIKYGDDYYKDLISTCCDISDRHKDYIKMANNSLKAWEEVLQELENKRDFVGRFLDTERNSGRFDAYDAVINIINQKLAEIEEVR